MQHYTSSKITLAVSACRIKREEDRIKRELEEKELQVRSDSHTDPVLKAL